MSKIRFITLRTGSYTTANEIGRYLISNGIKVHSDDFGSNHFGTKFNSLICSQMKDMAPHLEKLGITEDDFPKLITKDENGDEILQNRRIVKTLISTKMCENGSVSVLRKGTNMRGLDLYTPVMVEKLVYCFGEKYNIQFKEEDFEFLQYLAVTPYFEPTKRKDYNCDKTSQSQLIPKFKEEVTINDKDRCTV